MKFNTQILIEQFALLFASFTWTIAILVTVIIFWTYQDVQARWEVVVEEQAVAQAEPSPTATPPPTPTTWAGPGATVTPTETRPPTPTATRVILPPDLLPETLNEGEPEPVAVEIEEDAPLPAGLEQPPRAVGLPAPRNTPTPTATRVVSMPWQKPTATPQPAIVAPATAGGGVPDRLAIASIGLDSVIEPVGWQVIQQGNKEFSIWQVANYAVGWHKTSAKLGEVGNTVLAGHHNVYGEVFRDLVNVEVGDEVVVYSGGQQFVYEIDMKTIVPEKNQPLEVRKKNAEWIAPTQDERLTFVTCWPYTDNTHRVIVTARPK
jgi:sortase A